MWVPLKLVSPSALAFNRSATRCGKPALTLPVVRGSLMFFLVAPV